jgi:hypothetical protein
VDFSGHWVLNQADSDDPQRILQSQFKAAVGKTSDTGTGNGGDDGGGRGRRGGRGGGSGGRQGGSQGGTGDSNDGGVSAIGRGPLPSMDLMSAAVRWPGRSLIIAQSSEAVTLNSDEASVECKPMSGKRMSGQKSSSGEHRRSATDADLKQFCGLMGKSLVLHTGNMDEDHPPFVERFKISADGSRLIELVGFGQRGGGFSLSRVWDKAADTAQTPTNTQVAP